MFTSLIRRSIIPVCLVTRFSQFAGQFIHNSRFYQLPALGYYNSGQLNNVGNNGNYWSSSANPWNSNNAYNLNFNSGNVNVNNNNRNNGFRAEALQ